MGRDKEHASRRKKAARQRIALRRKIIFENPDITIAKACQDFPSAFSCADMRYERTKHCCESFSRACGCGLRCDFHYTKHMQHCQSGAKDIELLKQAEECVGQKGRSATAAKSAQPRHPHCTHSGKTLFPDLSTIPWNSELVTYVLSMLPPPQLEGDRRKLLEAIHQTMPLAHTPTISQHWKCESSFLDTSPTLQESPALSTAAAAAAAVAAQLASQVAGSTPSSSLPEHHVLPIEPAIVSSAHAEAEGATVE